MAGRASPVRRADWTCLTLPAQRLLSFWPAGFSSVKSSGTIWFPPHGIHEAHMDEASVSRRITQPFPSAVPCYRSVLHAIVAMFYLQPRRPNLPVCGVI